MSAEQDLARALASVGGNFGKRNAKDANRAYYQKLLAAGSDTSPVQHWAQGLARITQGLAGGWLAGHERRKEEAGGAAIAEAAKSGDFKTLAEALAKAGDTGTAAQVAIANAMYGRSKEKEAATEQSRRDMITALTGGAPAAGTGSGAGAAAGGAVPLPAGEAPPGGKPGSFESMPAPTGGAVDVIRMVEEEARKQGVPVEIAKRLAMQESGGNPRATGPVTKYGRAQGVMQLIPGTAQELGVANPYDAQANIRGGVTYLKQQLAKYGDVTLALAAYNMGPGAVDTWIKGGADPAKLPQETRQYIARILGEGEPSQAFPRGPLTAAGSDAPVQSAGLPPPGGPVAPVPPPMPAQAPVGAPPMPAQSAGRVPPEELARLIMARQGGGAFPAPQGQPGMPAPTPGMAALTEIPSGGEPYGMTGPTPPPAGAAPQIAGGALRFVPSAQAAPTPGLPPMPAGPPQIGPQSSSATAAEGMPLGAPPAPVAAPPASPVVPAQFQPGAPVAPPQGAPQAAPTQPPAPAAPAQAVNPYTAPARDMEARAAQARAGLKAAAQFAKTDADVALLMRQEAQAREMEQEARRLALEAQKFDIERHEKMGAAGAKAADKGFDQEEKLRKAYTDQIKGFGDYRGHYQRILASAEQPSAAGDIAMVYSFMKMLDPTSVVREGEFATAANAGGVDDRIRTVYNKIISGERLTTDIRKDFLDRAARIFDKAYDEYEGARKTFGGLAKSYNLDPERVTPDMTYGVGRPVFTQPPDPGAPGAPPAPPAGSGPVRVTSEAEINQLPSGAVFITPDGKRKVKP